MVDVGKAYFLALIVEENPHPPRLQRIDACDKFAHVRMLAAA